MIIDDLDVVGLCVSPTKDDTPLSVDTDAVKPRPLTVERLEPIARRSSKITEVVSCVEGIQLSQGDGSQIAGQAKGSTGSDPVVEILCTSVAERGDHPERIPIARYPCNRRRAA